MISLCPGEEVQRGKGAGLNKFFEKEKTRFSKIFQNSGGFFLRVSLHKETLVCNLATATTKVLVAHIPDKQRNV